LEWASAITIARSVRVSVTAATSNASYYGTKFSMNQPLKAAQAGKAVSMTWDLLLAGLTPTSTITIEIDRGSIGATTVTLYNYLGAQPVAVETVRWAGLSGGLNPKTVNWPARVLLQPAP